MTRTDSHSILLTLTRAAAICIAVLQVPQAIIVASNGFRDWGYVAFLVPIGINVFAAIVWLFADVLLRAALSRGKAATIESDIAPREWQYLIFSGIGLWLAAQGAINLVWWITAAAQVQTLDASQTFGAYLVDPENLGGVVSTLFQLMAGVALMLGARGLIGLLRRFRGR